MAKSVDQNVARAGLWMIGFFTAIGLGQGRWIPSDNTTFLITLSVADESGTETSNGGSFNIVSTTQVGVSSSNEGQKTEAISFQSSQLSSDITPIDQNQSFTVEELVSDVSTIIVSDTITIIVDDAGTSPMDTNENGWQWFFRWDWYIIMKLIICLIGVFGNLLVIVAIAARRAVTNSTDIFICALALFDLLTSICNIPIPIAVQLPATILGALYCRVIHYNYHTWVCVITSSFILVGISFERLTAVIHPLRFREIFTTRRVYIYILLIWVFSNMSCAYYFIDFSAMLREDFSLENTCVASKDSDPHRLKALEIVTVINFLIRLVIPSALMIITQTVMAISLHRQSRRLRGAIAKGSRQSHHILARNRVLKMMFVLVVIFILCWAPSQIAWLVISSLGLTKSYIDSIVRQILNIITFINSSINPFIYGTQYPKFRLSIKELILGKTQKNVPVFGVDQSLPKKSTEPNAKITVLD